MMTMLQHAQKNKVHIISALSGALMWIVISIITDKKEPWDSDLFWSFGFIGMLLINAGTGFIEPTNIYSHGISSVALQPVVMIVIAGELGSMFPMGLIVFAFLGMVYSVGGLIGAFMKTKLFPMKGGSVND